MTVIDRAFRQRLSVDETIVPIKNSVYDAGIEDFVVGCCLVDVLLGCFDTEAGDDEFDGDTVMHPPKCKPDKTIGDRKIDFTRPRQWLLSRCDIPHFSVLFVSSVVRYDLQFSPRRTQITIRGLTSSARFIAGPAHRSADGFEHTVEVAISALEPNS